MIFLEQAFNAIQLGMMLFLTAAGLTLVFGIMNFINLAHGSLYMLGAFVGASVLGYSGSFALALLAGLTGAAVGAVVLDSAVLRWLYLRDHSAQVLGTFGLLLFFNEAVRMIWGDAPLFISMPGWLSGAVELFPGFRYPAYRLLVTLIGLAVAASMALLITRTRLGAMIRAGASNREMLQVMGVNVRALFALVFALGGALAGLAGTLMGPLQSVQVGMGEPVLILAFVVIVIGGMGSIKGAFVGSLLVGLVDTLGRFALPKLLGYTVGPALASLAIYLMMAAMLYFRPNGLFPAPASSAGGGQSPEEPPPRQGAPGKMWIAIGIIVLCLLLVAPLIGDSYQTRVLTRAMIMGIAALALNLVFGYGGMISFGHAAFLGVGAYAVGILASHGIAEGLVALPLALVAAALAGLVIGALALRTTGIFFIMITLAFAQMLYYLSIGLEDYGGDNGMPLASPTRIVGLLNLSNPLHLYYTGLATLAAVYLLGRAFVTSEFGLAVMGMRDNERRMRNLGYPTYRYKVVAFTLSAALCGLSGALLANADAYVGPTNLHWFMSGLLMIMVILGGQGSLIGPVLGAMLYVVVEEGLSNITEHWMVVFGPLLVVTVLLARHGLLALVLPRGAAHAR